MLHIAFTVSPCELQRWTANACVTGKVFVAQSVLLMKWQEAGNTEKRQCSTSFMPSSLVQGEQARHALVGELGAQWTAGYG